MKPGQEWPLPSLLLEVNYNGTNYNHFSTSTMRPMESTNEYVLFGYSKQIHLLFFFTCNKSIFF